MTHYIEADRLRAEIDKRYAEYRAKMKTDDFTYYEGMADALDLFEQFLDTILEQPVKGLDEAAENIYKTPFGTRAEDFKAGAEWQKEQDTREMIMSDGSYFQKCYELGKKDMKKEMLEDAIEGRVGQTGFHNSIYIKEPKWCDTLDKFNNGDKVRVIIIKDDK